MSACECDSPMCGYFAHHHHGICSNPCDYAIRARLDILEDNPSRSMACMIDFVRKTFPESKVVGVKELATDTKKPHLHFMIWLPLECTDMTKYLVSIRNKFRYACPAPAVHGEWSWSAKWGNASRPCPHLHMHNHMQYLTKDNSYDDIVYNHNTLIDPFLWVWLKNGYLSDMEKIKNDKNKRRTENVAETFLNFITHHTDSSTTIEILIDKVGTFIFGERKARNGSHLVVKQYVLLALFNIPHFNWDSNYKQQFNRQVLDSLNFDQPDNLQFHPSDVPSLMDNML